MCYTLLTLLESEKQWLFHGPLPNPGPRIVPVVTHALLEQSATDSFLCSLSINVPFRFFQATLGTGSKTVPHLFKAGHWGWGTTARGINDVPGASSMCCRGREHSESQHAFLPLSLCSAHFLSIWSHEMDHVIQVVYHLLFPLFPFSVSFIRKHNKLKYLLWGCKIRFKFFKCSHREWKIKRHATNYTHTKKKMLKNWEHIQPSHFRGEETEASEERELHKSSESDGINSHGHWLQDSW